MTKQAAKTRIQELREEINHHRYLYHVLDRQEISDAALDSLKKELADLEEEFSDLVTPDSPTQRVGGQALKKFKQVSHEVPMLSLTDAFTIDDLRNWEARNQKVVPGEYVYFVELKIDGVAVALRYQDGVFVQAATRGDGQVGEDVTHTVRTIEAIPLKLRKQIRGVVEVRGEVYMLKRDFEQFNKQRAKQGKPLYANPRNISAGSIRQLDPRLAAERPLRFFAWEITSGISLTTRQEEYETLQELGFPVPPHANTFNDFTEVGGYLKREEGRRLKYPFQVDGLVVKVNNLRTSERLGIVGKAPRGSIAYKFAAEEATTVVEDIVVQVGRTGVLTPVAHLRPVQVAGTTVSRATLHNADEIARKDIRVGDTVIIHKAGDIIPEVVQVLPRLRPKGAKKFSMPKTCPVCGSRVVRATDEAAHRCINRDCFPVQREKIIHAVGRAGFDIEGLGDKIVEQLLQTGLIEDVPDLWELEEGDLLPLEHFAEKSAQKLVDEIQAHKKITLARFLVALSIPQVGAVTAQDLAREFGSLVHIKKASIEKLAATPGIGNVVAQSIVDFFASSDVKKLLEKYKRHNIHVETYTGRGPLAGKIFLFTGSLPDMTRDEAKERVQALGGKVASAVGEEVQYVVVGHDPGSKAKKAKELGLKILTPAAFKKIIKR